MVHMWVESALSCHQVLVHLPPPPSYPDHAPQEQFPGEQQRSPVHQRAIFFAVGLGTAIPTTSSSGSLRMTTAAGGHLAIF